MATQHRHRKWIHNSQSSLKFLFEGEINGGEKKNLEKVNLFCLPSRTVLTYERGLIGNWHLYRENQVSAWNRVIVLGKLRPGAVVPEDWWIVQRGVLVAGTEDESREMRLLFIVLWLKLRGWEACLKVTDLTLLAHIVEGTSWLLALSQQGSVGCCEVCRRVR